MVRFFTIAILTLRRCHYAQMTGSISFSMFLAIITFEQAHGSRGPISLPSKRIVPFWESVYNSWTLLPRLAEFLLTAITEKKYRAKSDGVRMV
jgi:hypothetical protein